MPIGSWGEKYSFHSCKGAMGLQQGGRQGNLVSFSGWGYVMWEHQERHFRQRNHIPKKGRDSRATAQGHPQGAGWQRVPLWMLKQEYMRCLIMTVVKRCLQKPPEASLKKHWGPQIADGASEPTPYRVLITHLEVSGMLRHSDGMQWRGDTMIPSCCCLITKVCPTLSQPHRL